MGLRIIVPKGDGLAERYNRVVQLPQFRQSTAEVVVGLGMVGVQIQNMPETSNCLIEVTQTPHRIAQMKMCLHEFRSDFCRPYETRRCFFLATRCHQCCSEVKMCVGIVAVNLDGTGKCDDRFRELSQLLQRHTKIVVPFRKIGGQFDGPSIAGNRLLRLPSQFLGVS